MQQKRAEDMRNVDTRRQRPSISLMSDMSHVTQSNHPASVGSKGFGNFNLDISRKMELGKSFRPQNNEYRDDDDFEKELDACLTSTQSNLPLAEALDMKARTFSHGISRPKPNATNISTNIRRPNKVNDSFKLMPTTDSSIIRMGGTAQPGRTGMNNSNKSRSMRHSSVG